MFTLPTKLIPNKILAVYRTGSFIYGLDTDSSDEDYIVIVEDFDGGTVVKEEGIDYFVFGVPYFKKMIEFDNSVISYFAIWTDNTLLAEKNLVYIDGNFRSEFLELIKVDWDKHFLDWIKRVIGYFSIRIEDACKEAYHLFRIKSQAQYYKETGKFEYHFDEKDKAFALAYKENPRQHMPELFEAFAYLEEISKEATT